MKKQLFCPQVLFLGNGLNRAFGANDWSKLLKQIHSNPRISFEQLKDLPYPLQAVLATGDHLDTVLKEGSLKEQGISDIEPMRPMMESLLRVPFDHILTTNYTYEIERVANSKVKQDGEYCKKCSLLCYYNFKLLYLHSIIS